MARLRPPLHSRSRFPHLVTAVLLCIPLAPLAAQCGIDWQPGAPSNGPGGSIAATLVLPNGDIVVGGNFKTADQAIVDNIARWNGTTWQPMGGGMNGSVRGLSRLPNGDLLAVGTFTQAGGLTCNRVARWNGVAWTALGSGANSTVFCSLVLPNGDIVVGGAFTGMGGVLADRVARWDGSSWSAIGAGLPTGSVVSLALAANGDIVAGGYLYAATTTVGAQLWNGTSWAPFPGFDPVGVTIEEVVRMANGDLAFLGNFSVGGQPGNAARWNGTAMQLLLPPVAGSDRTLIVASNGDLLVGGSTSSTASSLARFDGTAWSPISGGPAVVTSLALDGGGNLVVGSNPGNATPTERSVSRFDGFAWQTLGAPVPPTVRALLALPDDSVVVGGRFSSLGGVAAENVARWTGTTYAPLGLGVDAPASTLAVAPNGDILVGGQFAAAGGVPAARIARWNGQAWSTLGSGLSQPPVALAVAANGDVLAAMTGTGLRRFDGVQWSVVPFAGSIAVVNSLATLTNGDIAIGGLFNGYSGGVLAGVVIYQNGVISGLPAGPLVATRLFAAPDGSFFVVGSGVQRYDGSAWVTYPTITANTVGLLPNGEPIVGRLPQTVGGQFVGALARLRPTGWESFGDVDNGNVTSLAITNDGQIFAGGTFQRTGSVVSNSLARAVPSCPASITVVGAGCSGGAGPVTLSAVTGAWLGGTLRTQARGMTAMSLALQVLGTQPQLVALPGGAAGCWLFVDPIVSEVVATAGGEALTQYALPVNAAFVGMSLRSQVIGLELDNLGIVRLTSTNGLQFVLGAL